MKSLYNYRLSLSVLWLLLGCLCFTMCVTSLAHAQGLGQKTAIKLDNIMVESDFEEGTETSPTPEEAGEALRKIAGGIGFVEAEYFLDEFAQSLGDTLVFTPGVFADTSAQRENRISIRGSGLGQSFERRGLTLLRDGVPITRASGSTEFQEIDPLSIRYLEVYKGANGLRYGAASLGGAVNVVTPTGRTAGQTWFGRIEGGSFGSLRVNSSYAESDEDSDFYITATGLRSDGFRDHSDVKSGYLFSNAGWQLSPQLETRFYLTTLSDNFELAGALSLEDALATPKAVSPPVTIGPFFPGGPVTVLDPGPIADDWDRNLDVLRIANRTVYSGSGYRLEAGFWYSYRNLDHAITRFAGIIDQDEHEFGLFTQLSGDSSLGELPFEWLFGVQANKGSNDARRWANDFGQRGELTARSDQDAEQVVSYGQLGWKLGERTTLLTGVQHFYAKRDNQARVNDVTGRLDYQQWNPRLGMLYQLDPMVQLYANISRSAEPPSIADLTSGGALDFTPLGVQTAWTAELGSRGERNGIAWDVSMYRSWIDGELLKFGAPGTFGFVSFTENANNTTHQGIELGLDVPLFADSMLSAGHELVLRQVYTYNDFQFDNDPGFGDNRLAGVPEHLYISELRFDHVNAWYLAVNVRWVPDGPFADFANTVQVPGYALFGVNAGLELSSNISLYLSIENLFDKRYISNVTTNANQTEEHSRLFTPGQGAGVFGGINLRF